MTLVSWEFQFLRGMPPCDYLLRGTEWEVFTWLLEESLKENLAMHIAIVAFIPNFGVLAKQYEAITFSYYEGIMSQVLQIVV